MSRLSGEIFVEKDKNEEKSKERMWIPLATALSVSLSLSLSLVGTESRALKTSITDCAATPIALDLTEVHIQHIQRTCTYSYLRVHAHTHMIFV